MSFPSDPPERPDPDALLRRVQEDEARAKRGKLKIFFGFAPGVGKTYRMLQVARDLAFAQKLDVVIGIVEDHRRAETAALAHGLPQLPRKPLEYRGRTLMELDLDAALARKPKLLLVDELAHTNAPGSRHPKRFQDVRELIAAGIDVFTTLNVQHIESLNDVIAQITRVQVRETVPDSVLDEADAIELVDIAPEELLRRLQEGKVYLPEQAQRAASHFFQQGNLLALRELALRRTAQHVDEDVRAYREEHGVASTWPAGERILVCVGAAPSSSRLIRAAARMAAGLRCPWVAGYVETTRVSALNEADRERLEAHFRIAESLGASVTRLAGSSVAEALLLYARRHNVTRIILGKPTHSRLRDRLRGSLVDDVVRGSGDIDVHVISGDDEAPSAAREDGAAKPPLSIRRYALSVLLVGATTALAALLRASLGLPDLEMLFLLAVMVAAASFGRGASLVAAALSVACYDYFFVPPFYTFSVEDRRHFLTFAMMFGVSLVMSELVARLQRQEREALSREQRTAVLYALTRELASTDQPAQIATIASSHAADWMQAQAFVLCVSPEGELRVMGSAPAESVLPEKELGVARWCYEHDALAGLGTDTLPGAQSLCAPLRLGANRLGVLALMPREKAPLRTEQRAFLDVLARQVAVALERARLADDAKQAALRAKAEEMRSSLLSAVSHDLRTPLATITGAATSLRDDQALSAETRGELVESIVDQAERLERLVANLLDMTRLAAGAVVLKRDWVPLDETIGSALTRLESKLVHRKVKVEIAEDVPLLHVDPVLFEQVFLNLLENADKYTPAGTEIEISAMRVGDDVQIDVCDHGSGLASGTEARVFEKFYRGAHAGIAGAGLGLAICKAIVEAHGGQISAQNRAMGGALFRINLPIFGSPPPFSLEKEGP